MNNYTILARKWRPKTFDQVCGHKYILRAITNSLKLNKVHHAWLFSGNRGTGKTTIARLLATSLSCNIKTSINPCRTCSICKDIENNCFVDFIEVNGASHTRVEDIKSMLDTIFYNPSRAQFKIYLIDEIHMLSRHSFNALLKIVEEPPKHVKFIFATTEIEKVPQTIISRCLIFRLNTLKSIEIYDFISNVSRQENILIESEALRLISNHAAGSMRDALNLLEQAVCISSNNKTISSQLIIELVGSVNTEQVFKITQSVLKKDTKNVFDLLQEYDKKCINLDNLLIEILKLLHFISILKLYPPILKYEKYMLLHKKDLSKFSKILSFDTLKKYYYTILNGRKLLHFSPTKRIGIEIILLEMLHIN